jgi:hypothetical protein
MSVLIYTARRDRTTACEDADLVCLPHFPDGSGSCMAPPYHQKNLSNQVKVGQHSGEASTLEGGLHILLERQLEDTPAFVGR